MSKVIENTGWGDLSIEVTDTIAAQDTKFVKYPAGNYNVSNPHPGFGIDPNILNEYGHTKYPMWVGDKIANNEAEEKALRGESGETDNTELEDGGPTIKEYVEAGYKASGYPPSGYKSKSTKEEIKEYLDKETPDPWGGK